MRNLLFGPVQRGDRHFRWRGHDVSRVEGFSDAVFAFALTLLVVSLEVPRTFADLRAIMLAFPAFAACFALLVLVWYEHYLFFRRYGLQDGGTVAWNAVLLFLVVFYVYPLKFLALILLNLAQGRVPRVTAPDGSTLPAVQHADMNDLMLIYGAGYFAIYLVFWIQTRRALARAAGLELDAVEIQLTREHLQRDLLLCAIGIVSMAVALLPFAYSAFWSGMTYWLIGPVLWMHGWRAERRLRPLVTQRAAAATGPHPLAG